MLRTVAPLVVLLDQLKHVPIDIQATPYTHAHTHTAARRAGPPGAAIPAGALFVELLQLCCSSGVALEQAEARAAISAPGIALLLLSFADECTRACFTSTKVQILTPMPLPGTSKRRVAEEGDLKIQDISDEEERGGGGRRRMRSRC